MQQTQLADKLPSEFEPLDWELGQDRNVTSPWILTIISGPRLPPDLYDTCSVSSCSSGTLDHLWTSLPSGLVSHLFPRELWIIFGTRYYLDEVDELISVDFYNLNFDFSLNEVILGFMPCAIFLVVCRHPLDPSLLIQHATFNKRTRILIFHLQQLVGCKTFLWLVHCALTDSNGGSP